MPLFLKDLGQVIVKKNNYISLLKKRFFSWKMTNPQATMKSFLKTHQEIKNGDLVEELHDTIVIRVKKKSFDYICDTDLFPVKKVKSAKPIALDTEQVKRCQEWARQEVKKYMQLEPDKFNQIVRTYYGHCKRLMFIARYERALYSAEQLNIKKNAKPSGKEFSNHKNTTK